MKISNEWYDMTMIGHTWHCIIGEAFGFDMTYQNRNLLFLYHQVSYRHSAATLLVWCLLGMSS
jgi:hypothetical protein